MSLAFWLVGLALFAGPFLLVERAAADPEGDDPGRLVSEIDIPYEEDVDGYEEEFGPGLRAEIESTSADLFGLESEELLASGLFKPGRLAPGKTAYERHCTGCHGANGNGAGPAARHLYPRPRNFRRGVFKFTSTETGSPPLPRDVFQTITNGLAGSSMPDFRLVSEEQRWDLVEYVRYLTLRGSFEQLMLDVAWEEEEVPDGEDIAGIVLRRWQPENLRAVYPPVSEIPRTPDSITHGREVFLSAGVANCAACHGEDGKGQGPSSEEFLDDWGYPIVPRDLTGGVFRAGSDPADLYRSIATGINGTPMPSFGSSLEPEDIWSMVHFIQSLGEQP